MFELKVAVGGTNGDGWTVVSDEHQSILKAISAQLPKAEHRHCARHIYANWKASFKGEEMKLLFWRCVKCGVHPSSSTVFQVSYLLDTVEVNLERKSCTCRKWDLRGIPCCHAIAAIFYVRKEVEAFVDQCYTRDAYLLAYAGSIPPITGERHWPQVGLPLDPPPVKVGPGRPRKSRIKSKHEDPKRPGKLTKHGVEMTCTLCKELGHNKRGCPRKGASTSSTPIDPTPPAKRARGRPKKIHEIPSSTPDNQLHYNITAQPSSTESGGKTIRAGQGVRGAISGAGRNGRGKGAAGRGRGKGSVTGRGRGRSATAMGDTQELASLQVYSTQASIQSEQQST